MLSLHRCWRVEHPSWSAVYRAPASLGDRPDAAQLEVTGRAVAVFVDGLWLYATDAGVGGLVTVDEVRALAKVRIAVWPRTRSAFMAARPADSWRPTRFVVDAAEWTGLATIARSTLRDAVHWTKGPGVMRSDLVERESTGQRIRALARTYGVALEEES